MKYNWPLIKIDPLWYMIPIDPIDPPDPDDPPTIPVLPGLGQFLRKRYTSNLAVSDEMTVADLINDVILTACRGYLGVGPTGKIRMRNKRPADYAFATTSIPSGTTITADDVSPWVNSLLHWIVIDPYTLNSEVREVVSAVYPTTQNSTTLTSNEPTEIIVTAFSGAAGGSTPATATIDTTNFVDSTTYSIFLDGIEIAFIPSTGDTDESVAAFIAGTIRGNPHLNRRFLATYAGAIVTITARFGTLTLNTATLMTHAAPVAEPATAPTLTATASGDLPAGTYRVSYSWRNDRGQTLLSPFKSVTIAANEKITVSAVSPPAGCTVVWYVSIEAGSEKMRFYLENSGASFVIDWPLPKRTAPMPPGHNRTGAEIIRVSGVYSDREEERSAIGDANVIQGTFEWQLGNRRSRKNIVELTYRHAAADYRLVTLRERDDANIAKVKEKRTEKVNGQAIDTFFQAKRISSGLLAEWLDADFFYRWRATRRALLQEEGDVVVVTDDGSGVINLPVWIEEMELNYPHSGLPAASFTAHKYYSTLYDDSINEVSVPIISEVDIPTYDLPPLLPGPPPDPPPAVPLVPTILTTGGVVVATPSGEAITVLI